MESYYGIEAKFGGEVVRLASLRANPSEITIVADLGNHIELSKVEKTDNRYRVCANIGLEREELGEISLREDGTLISNSPGIKLRKMHKFDAVRYKEFEGLRDLLGELYDAINDPRE